MGPVSAAAIGAGVGAVVALFAAPAALGFAGFTSAGVAAGSVAAKMMSAAAVANGGGVAAGSAVAVLQSAGAAGLSGAVTAAVTGTGAAAGYLGSFFRR
ncbi:interferon alpha-inducible protein 27-like protein 2A [Sparus aurata]|uniref:interferon alpha-inducible protein 27-like protein 2A n=1 Tax=Sparus aurata TaxID=8175 RepID=UPI0011C1764F|nr:interferon alpha-inducible protein 27-like protein 2A [Sparus aurata]